MRDTGEPYRPVPVETVLGQPDVVLLGPDGTVVRTAPVAADLYGKGDGYQLDFPGSPLDAGCSYEQWFDRIATGKPTTAYAHIVTEQGELALQYWFYYPFNDWNNKHESDWEMIQLVFDAADGGAGARSDARARRLLAAPRSRERDLGRREAREADGHPVVYPGAGSHANQFVQSLYLGHSAQTGFGCDDTRGPTNYEQAQVVLVPSEASGAGDPFAWLGYLGRWGQQVSGPNSGPTGPTFKGQWTKPISWVDEEWRSDNVQVPASSSVAPTATGFFCTAVAKGSEIYLRFLRNPFFVLGVLAAIVLLAVWLSRRTNWSPALPIRSDSGARPARSIARGSACTAPGVPLHRDRADGDPDRSARGDRTASPVRGDRPGLAHRRCGRGSGGRCVRGLALRRRVHPLIAATLVYAACAEALDRIDEGEQPDALDAYRGIVPTLLPLAWATLRMTIVAGLLVVTVIGIPFAVVYLIRKAVTLQSIVIEERGATSGLKRSSDLVRGRGPRVLAIAGLVNGTVAVLGPIIGVAMMFVTPASLGLINLVSSLVYVFVLPAVGITLALLFYDLRIRREGEQVSPASVPRLATVRPDTPEGTGPSTAPQNA